MTTIIPVSGHAGVGKDTFAKILKEELEGLGKRTQILHYAWLLKRLCKELYDWDGEKDETGRTILQHVGTDVVRQKRPEYWAGFLVGLVSLFQEEWDCVIIPDTRFPNEVECWDMLRPVPEVYHIRVERRKNPIWDSMTDEQRQHPSAISLDEYPADYIVRNNYSLDTLRFEAQYVACYIMGI